MATAQGDRKVWAFGDQSKLAEGVRKGADVVASTLGPAGGNVLLERKNRTPICVDDGYTAINALILDDELENLGVSALVDAANKASEYAGDGTSTTICLTRAIYDAGRKLIGDGMLSLGLSTFQVREKILAEKEQVLKLLKKLSKAIKTKEEIKKVALSAYADEKMADIVADTVSTVGENGVVIVEEGWGRDTEVEITEGMKFAGKLAHGFFANTPEENLNLEGYPILVTDFDFVNLNDIQALVKEVASVGDQGLVVVANKYDRTAIEQIVRVNLFNAQNRSSFKIFLIRTPSFTNGEFEDFSIFCGAKWFSKERGDNVINAVYADLGRLSVLKITKAGEGIAVGGSGTKQAVKDRIKELKALLADEKVKMLKGRIEQRIASLASAFGVIKVASPSEGETEHIRLKTKNAVKSCQSAVAEGVVPGGGLVLKEIASKLPDGSILKEALDAPYKIIQKNAGGKLEIPEIYDSVKVIRTAVEQACSTAWQLINTKVSIAFRNEPDRADAARIIKGEATKKED